MSDSQPSKVVMFDNADPEMQEAYGEAREYFKYFWREMAWERRRIIPALDMACVKAPFSDGEKGRANKDHPQVEEMWLKDIGFDGQFVTGVLLNTPNWLKSVKEGDSARLPLTQISDWMYSSMGEVYGAFTVNLMRSRMNRAERKDHDGAWGLDFGDPARVRVSREEKKSVGFFQKIFGGGGGDEVLEVEHPMSVNMASVMKAQIEKNPSMLTDADDRGWTFLHQDSLAGSLPTVQVLLDCGAKVNVKSKDGKTPLQLARALRWEKVEQLLVSKGAK